MKYVLQWTPRQGGSGADAEVGAERTLALFTNWTPSASPSEFVTRIDGGGGFSVVETDDPHDVLDDIGKFATHLDFTVYPVVDIAGAVPNFQSAIDYRKSIS